MSGNPGLPASGQSTPGQSAAGPVHPGMRVLVHGLGRFGGGQEAVRFLARRGCHVRIADRSAGDDMLAVQKSMQDLPRSGAPDLDWQLGREDEALLQGIDLFVANPGVPDHHPLLAAARKRGLPVTQEVDLFLSAYPGTVVAITGTNGKSTTSTLLHAALARSGQNTLLGGNIGHSLLADEANWQKDQVAVLEISSFQLERLAQEQRVHGAVFTRVLKDHVDRHGTLAAYHTAKGRLATAAVDFVVHAADDPVAAAYASSAARRVRFAATEPAPDSAGLLDGFLSVRLGQQAAERIVHRDSLRLLGEFQWENVMAASAAARCLGAAPHAIGIAMATAAPLPFRLQLLAVIGGVRVYDNGVSTEIESTRSALRTLSGPNGPAGPLHRVHWVGGGKSKDDDYATVADGVVPHIAAAHLFGAAAKPLQAAIAGRRPVTAHTTLAEALTAAFAAAAPGEVILFSPAFASFDQYPNFRARALEFHSWLASRRAQSTAFG
ncbi:MAG: UDP-N-acetylmuramoyl-L-alanine--D-glutamate ligase [Planctomycetes bacterium]|nr:UDP-N-acetylmuramoyl-L-alanine--D-glutamate ligase [Planctomycetota bacterium]